jgi:hypothetical protein
LFVHLFTRNVLRERDHDIPSLAILQHRSNKRPFYSSSTLTARRRSLLSGTIGTFTIDKRCEPATDQGYACGRAVVLLLCQTTRCVNCRLQQHLRCGRRERGRARLFRSIASCCSPTVVQLGLCFCTRIAPVIRTPTDQLH